MSVFATNRCGSSPVRTLAVNAGTVPDNPGPIVSPAPPCVNSTAVFSLAPVNGATSYTWTLPSGWTASSLTTTSPTITVTTTATGGTMTVTAVNGCGPSLVSSSTAVTVNVGPSAVNITGNTFLSCPSEPHAFLASATSPIPVTYTWSLPTGWTGTSTTSIINTVGAPTAGSGTISVTANNGCGTATGSAPVSVAIIVVPSVTVAKTPAGTTCLGDYVTFTATPVNGGVTPVYQWRKNGIVVGSNNPGLYR